MIVICLTESKDPWTTQDITIQYQQFKGNLNTTQGPQLKRATNALVSMKNDPGEYVYNDVLEQLIYYCDDNVHSNNKRRIEMKLKFVHTLITH